MVGKQPSMLPWMVRGLGRRRSQVFEPSREMDYPEHLVQSQVNLSEWILWMLKILCHSRVPIAEGAGTTNKATFILTIN